MNRIGPRQLREMAQERIGEVLAALFPSDRVTFPVFTPRNPTRDDKHPGSFVIWTRGPACGGFREYARGDSEKGDVIDLVAYIKGGDRAFALRWLEDLFGIRTMDPELLKRAKTTARAKACEIQRADNELLARKRKIAGQMFAKAEASIVGTVAEDYLAARGIAYRALKYPESDLRFSPALEWWKGAKWKQDGSVRNKVEAGPKFPAIVSAMRNAAGEITAVHCTFLRADGSGKADVEGAKLMFGQVKGSVIRLTRGPSNLTWEEAAREGVLEPVATGEGIETMLSVALALPECAVVAAGSLDNIANTYLDHARVDEGFVCFDNDKSPKLATRRNAIMDTLGSYGKPVAVMMPPEGFNDWNEV